MKTILDDAGRPIGVVKDRDETSPFAQVFGKWPGDETDAELAAALKPGAEATPIPREVFDYLSKPEEDRVAKASPHFDQPRPSEGQCGEGYLCEKGYCSHTAPRTIEVSPVVRHEDVNPNWPLGAPSDAAAHRAQRSGEANPVVTDTCDRRQEVIEQLCKMLWRAWSTIDPDSRNPCDCICRPTEMRYQNSGEALTFMEEAISEAIARHGRRSEAARPADGLCVDCLGNRLDRAKARADGLATAEAPSEPVRTADGRFICGVCSGNGEVDGPKGVRGWCPQCGGHGTVFAARNALRRERGSLDDGFKEWEKDANEFLKESIGVPPRIEAQLQVAEVIAQRDAPNASEAECWQGCDHFGLPCPARAAPTPSEDRCTWRQGDGQKQCRLALAHPGKCKFETDACAECKWPYTPQQTHAEGCSRALPSSGDAEYVSLLADFNNLAADVVDMKDSVRRETIEACAKACDEEWDNQNDERGLAAARACEERVRALLKGGPDAGR